MSRAFQTKKKLGQHFLVNTDALNAIVEALEIQPDDDLLEIGPGIGFLTRLLCEKAKRVTAVELDRESVDYLKALKIENLDIKHGDFLAYEILSRRFREPGSQAWKEQDKERRPLKIAGNVPYQITGLILGHLLGEIGSPTEHLKHIDSIVLTVQKEVAERMVAKAGSYHYAQLSLMIAYFCKSEIVLHLPAFDFFPAPRVDSAIVRLTPLKEAPLNCRNHKLLRRVIKAGFKQRRKMLRNALLSLGIEQEKLNQLFKELRFDPQVRAESLSLEQFAMLTDALESEIDTHASNNKMSGETESDF
ncbi:MAG: 16S rRNA (adenine(1518)-N(6)/adenine(1519)-N(6))-dimethyltransferase RsmA [Candidatus Obscuribacterales bacterium]|nr:16S rRNA (adenine(1518)-N(6)/adenine(1519)-N(6))-dimethyltransferase RsmA [Candidatus Obscuribacterales bacterium]